MVNYLKMVKSYLMNKKFLGLLFFGLGIWFIASELKSLIAIQLAGRLYLMIIGFLFLIVGFKLYKP